MAGAPELRDIEGVLLGTLRRLLSAKKPQLGGVETMTAGSNPLAYCGQMSWLHLSHHSLVAIEGLRDQFPL